MFFSFSKIFWLLFQPVTIIFVLMLAALVLVWARFRRLGLSLLAVAAIVVFSSSYTTLGSLLLAPLEDRFPKQPNLPHHVEGIVVLGGYMNGDINAGRPGFELNSAADRIFEAMHLARLYPSARVIVSGGDGAFFEKAMPEAESTRSMLAGLGFSGERFIFENKSRNTVENAAFSKALAHPKAGETWLLVTSAYHMPRSIGCFRKAGFEVIAWPVDYKTPAKETFSLYLEAPNDALSRFSVAMREWVGLTAYWLTGKTDMLLPQP
ncbi:YdcF family protein [Falsochrobactrum sp. TDYN1]|uniref:YdcF family protein n=1 Tax=Falsochrobactrum tianjinense TaxID=2706015 RepID=A0A949PPI3_9HYPH|nr:YdcF family protein [Falsochrobactrum sp. TDYN1]MBV2144618.1 YdcF family protein [Falsochrobactrum sp. TDYN1]